jgi:hypothetical protein
LGSGVLAYAFGVLWLAVVVDLRKKATVLSFGISDHQYLLGTTYYERVFAVVPEYVTGKTCLPQQQLGDYLCVVSFYARRMTARRGS